MSLFPFSDVESALAVADGRNALTVSGVVLFAGRERAVFVADGKASTQRESLAFFSNTLPRLVAGTALLAAHRMTGRWLPRARIVLPDALRERVDADFSTVALYCGSPGPLQKLTLYGPPREQGRAGVVVKISLRPSADALIEREAANLSVLSHLSPDVISHVPRLMCWGRLESGRAYLATDAVTGRVAPGDLRGSHLGFLASLARATARPLPWAGGPASSRTRSLISSLPDRALPEGLTSTLLRVVDDVESRLGSKPVPHVYSHGDFTRFNIRDGVAGFTVFDWEYASDLANPLADLLHYPLSQPTRRDAVQLMQGALTSAGPFLSSMSWEYLVKPPDVAALALHSLVDTVAFYASSGGGLNMDSYIVRRYVGLIRDRAQWGAA